MELAPDLNRHLQIEVAPQRSLQRVLAKELKGFARPVLESISSNEARV